MGSVLVIDGSGVCRAPIVVFTLRERLGLPEDDIVVRGLDARPDATMCESAAARIGYSGSAIAFFGAYRSQPLRRSDVEGADLVLIAERAQRSAVVRLLPGSQAAVFTWREALLLSTGLADRIRMGTMLPLQGFGELARAMHGVRGRVPIIEPPTRTSPFHWRRIPEADPLSIADGHAEHADHRRITQLAIDVANDLADAITATATGRTLPLPVTLPRQRRLRRSDRREELRA